jgi:hypothetical protein
MDMPIGARRDPSTRWRRDNPVGHYLGFMVDLTTGMVGRVSYEPDPGTRPTNAFVWKVICDADLNVIVAAAAGDGTQVIATARWRDNELRELLQKAPNVPTSYQWSLVETAVRAELAACIAKNVATSDVVERIAEIEAGFASATIDRASAAQQVARLAERKRSWKDRFAKGSRVRGLLYVALAVAILVPVIAASAIVRSRSTRSQPVQHEVARAATPVPAAPPPAPVPDAPESLEMWIANSASFEAAIAIAKPEMRDTSDELGGGAKLLATYASAKLRWADVDVPPETTVGRVEKDPELERGKRMCATGELVRIERRDLANRKIYVGQLRTIEGDQIRFVAVGTTGDLVKRSSGKLCGAVIGKSGGAVSLVGMFDLPENRHPLVEQ